MGNSLLAVRDIDHKYIVVERKNIMIHDEPEILRMSEVQLREVDWLWYPYIPFGKLTILQGYLGERIDMNRANEIREVMKSVGQVAQRTGCAVVLVGHLNKAAGLSSAYRGLGSIDFRAAARSVLVVGRLRKNKTVRIVVHDKSSLAPEGKSLAFQLGDGEGFRWLDGYDEISAEELLSGFSSQPETKTAQAEELIRSMLEDGVELHCEEIIRAAADRQISRRTVNEAKKNISGIVTRKAGARWLWSMENEDCNIAEVSLKEG